MHRMNTCHMICSFVYPTSLEMEPEKEEGGYDLEFVTKPPDSLLCLICLSVVRSPWQHGTCGRLFCDSCLGKCRRRNRSCPSCRGRNAKYFQDSKSEWENLDLPIRTQTEVYIYTVKPLLSGRLGIRGCP